MTKLSAYLLFFASSLVYTYTHAQTPRTIRTYHKNGSIKTITHQGFYNSCGVPIGTDSIYNNTGGLIKTITYQHTLLNGKSCHDLSTKSTVILYYKNGKPKEEQHYVSCYECEPAATGTWRWYNQRGDIIQQENKMK